MPTRSRSTFLFMAMIGAVGGRPAVAQEVEPPYPPLVCLGEDAGWGDASNTDELYFKTAPRDQFQSIPYENISGTNIIRVCLNGEPVWATVDNRSGQTVVHRGFAERHGLPDTGGMDIGTLSGSTEVGSVENLRVELPSNIRFRTPAWTSDLSTISSAIGRELTLIIGAPIIHNTTLIFDSRKMTMVLAPSGSIRMNPRIPEISVTGESDRISVELDGNAVELTIDLGYNGNMKLGEDTWELLYPEKVLEMQRLIDLRGVSEQGRGNISHVRIDSKSFESVDVTVSPLDAEYGDGFVGFGLLSRGLMVLDIKAGKLWLE